MAVIELFPYEREVAPSPQLRVVRSSGRATVTVPSLEVRRVRRAAMLRRRRRAILTLTVLVALVLLAIPGHAFGGVNGVGLSTDYVGNALTPGSVIVVQPGETLAQIAAAANPESPKTAYRVLEKELRSSTVIAGEHVLIP